MAVWWGAADPRMQYLLHSAGGHLRGFDIWLMLQGRFQSSTCRQICRAADPRQVRTTTCSFRYQLNPKGLCAYGGFTVQLNSLTEEAKAAALQLLCEAHIAELVPAEASGSTSNSHGVRAVRPCLSALWVDDLSQ